MSTHMAIRYHGYGAPDQLKLESVETPAPAEGEVLIRVHFAGVNPIDWKLRSGAYHAYMPITFPGRPGIDVSGVIEAVGPNVTAFRKGQAVFGCGIGAYSELALAKASDLALKPEGLSFEAAASLPAGALTAWALVENSGVKAGQRVLVQGAAGGVGLFAVQFAKLKGATVFGSASAGNAEYVKTLGAQALDYARSPLAVEDLDVVIDTVGGAVLESSFTLVKKGGVLVTAAGQPSADKAKELGITARSVGRGPSSSLPEIADLVVAQKVVAEVQKVFALKDAAKAHELSQTGHGRGRILLKP